MSKTRKKTEKPAAKRRAKKLTDGDTFLDILRVEKAAQLLAEGSLPVTAIAASVGVSRNAVYKWIGRPEFAARVQEIAKNLSDLSLRFAIASRVSRLANLDERLQRMQRICAARAEDVPACAGGDSGLLVRRKRVLGTGRSARVVDEFVFDAALAREMRETEEQAAQECGQRVTKFAPTSPEGDREYTGICAPDLEAYRQLPIAERIRLLRSSLRAPPVDRADAGVREGDL